jgi:phosphate transport system substrate-binding protein
MEQQGQRSNHDSVASQSETATGNEPGHFIQGGKGMRFRDLIRYWIIAAMILVLGIGSAHARPEIRIVGSTAVLPFMEIIAENFANHWEFPPPSLEDTGTGQGFRLFGSGVGFNHPDMVATPRPMTDAEWHFCRKNGVDAVTEIIIGRDAIVFVNLKSSPQYNFTIPQLFNAMAANVETDGHVAPNPFTRWHQISPHLPDLPITIMGPPPASSTYDALVQTVMIGGCEHFPAIQALDEDARFRACRMFRDDSKAFVEGLKHSLQRVRWLARHPYAFAFMRYAVYTDFSDQLSPNAIDGVRPTVGIIPNKTYPLSRPIYLYVKIPHVAAVPGLQQFLYEATSERAISPEGYLATSGFVPLGHRGRNHARDQALSLTAKSR